MAKIKSRRRESKSSPATVTDKIPLVSVIMPMYNSAEFVPQTLESLCLQTLQDFEVVVVDDCSTDNSVEVVESFKPQFDGRLHVIKLPKNSGTPGLPRNVGIQFARGKYIAFLDSDDLFTKTALEELTTLAEEYQAEVVHTDTFYLQSEEEGITVCKRQSVPIVSEPTVETNDLAKRIRQWVQRGYNWESVTMFCERDFLIGKQIWFPNLTNYEDMLFTFAILCSAENLLRVPNLTYIYRQRSGSVSYQHFADASARLHKYIRVLNDGFNALEKIMATIPLFKKYADYRYAVLEFYFNDVLNSIYPVYAENSPAVLNDIIKKEFHAENASFAAHLFNDVNICRFKIMQLQREFANCR